MGKCLKVKKNWNLVVSRPEKHNLMDKTGINIKFYFSRKKKHSFFADTKLQIDEVKRKIVGKFKSPCLLKKQTILKVRTTTSFSVKTKYIVLELLEKPTDPIT